MIGSKRNDSSTIRATPSASGELRISRNFSINSSARSDDGTRAWATSDAEVTAVAFVGGAEVRSLATGPVSSKISSGTPSARDIRRSVPAWGLLVLPRSI